MSAKFPRGGGGGRAGPFLARSLCLQLDSNFIAINLRAKMGLEHFSISHIFFTNNWPPSWTPSWIY